VNQTVPIGFGYLQRFDHGIDRNVLRLSP